MDRVFTLRHLAQKHEGSTMTLTTKRAMLKSVATINIFKSTCRGFHPEHLTNLLRAQGESRRGTLACDNPSLLITFLKPPPESRRCRKRARTTVDLPPRRHRNNEKTNTIKEKKREGIPDQDTKDADEQLVSLHRTLLRHQSPSDRQPPAQ